MHDSLAAESWILRLGTLGSAASMTFARQRKVAVGNSLRGGLRFLPGVTSTIRRGLGVSGPFRARQRPTVSP